jgi:hypothetical protein
MKNTLLLGLILMAFIGEAQIKRVSVRMSAGYPVMKDVVSDQNLVLMSPWYMGTSGSGSISNSVTRSIRTRFDEKMGLEFAGAFDYEISPKFFLSTGLGVSYLHFKKNYSLETSGPSSGTGLMSYYVPQQSTNRSVFGNGDTNTDGATLLYSTNEMGTTNLLYIQVPLLAGISLKKQKLFLRAGTTLAYSAYSSEIKVDANGEDYKDTNSDNLKNLIVNGTINATYYFSKKIGAEVSLNRSLNSLYKSDKINYTTISLGITYALSL